MKITKKIKFLYVLLIGCMLFVTGVSVASPLQKKTKVRMSVMYVKVMNDHSYFQITAKAKAKRGYEPVANLKLTIYRVFGDSTTLLGEVETQDDGLAEFILKELVVDPLDTSGHFVYKITNEDTDEYMAGEKQIDIVDINLMANILTKDSINYVSARITEPGSGTPVSGVRLKVNLKRYFAPLQIGKSSYKSDENGLVLVPVTEDMPGIDGVLAFEVFINESDEYGTVKTSFEAPVGVPVVATDTFDQRTMWSPPSKTPYSMLLVPNIIIVSIWLILIVLTFNLYKISKSKN